MRCVGNKNDFTTHYIGLQGTTRGHSGPLKPPGLKLLYCKVDVLYQMGKVFQAEVINPRCTRFSFPCDLICLKQRSQSGVMEYSAGLKRSAKSHEPHEILLVLYRVHLVDHSVASLHPPATRMVMTPRSRISIWAATSF